MVFPTRLFRPDPKLDWQIADTVRLSFFLRELAEPSAVYIGTVGLSPLDATMNLTLRGEKVPAKPGEAPGELFFIE